MSNSELPNIFKNSSVKKRSNNMKVFYSKYNNYKSDVAVDDVLDVKNSYYDTIDSLFRSGKFVFNVFVEIVTKEGVFYTKIVSKIDDHIVTSESKIIKLDDIVSIRIKE